MHTIEERGVAGASLESLRHLAAHFGLVFEPLLAVLHLAAKIGAGIEPVARCVLRFVAGGVQVVKSVRQPIQRIGIKR